MQSMLVTVTRASDHHRLTLVTALFRLSILFLVLFFVLFFQNFFIRVVK